MIPRIAKLGHGFAGAGLYYLHDKRETKPERTETRQARDRPSAEDYHLRDKGGAQTSHRVGFTATRNLPTTDPQKALRCMQWLAANAHAVRQAAVAAAAKAAGMSYADYVRAANPFRGRKGQKPLYTLSIAWHPKFNRKPTKTQMLAAADEVLMVLGLQDRQALIVQHTDTRHPHVHLIVNRVSPINGLYASVGNDRLRLSKWALDYEKRTGQVLCFERVENWKKRDANRFDKAERRKSNPNAKGEWVLARGVPRGDHDWFKSVAHLPPDEIRKARAARQEREREQLTRKLADRTMATDGRLTKRYGCLLADAERTIERLQRAEYWRKIRDRDPIALVLSPRHAFHALVDLVTARAYVRPRRIAALQKTADALRRVMRDERHREIAKQNSAWGRLTVRHDAERRRDEERIARLAAASRGKETTERGRKVFNLRGAVETARLVSPKAALVRLTDIHARIADKRKAVAAKAQHALATAVRTLGGQHSAADLKEQTLGGLQPSQVPVVTPDIPEVRSEPAQTQSPDTRRHAAAVTPEERRAFEQRRDRLVERIEAENKEKRRRRPRPRGKGRRLD
jgi:hypothetical protein